jgi:nucleoside-diphosphate-sugar epimerase
MKLKLGQYELDRKMKGISLYGGTGFIGQYFYHTFEAGEEFPIHLIPRYSSRPKPNTDILYMISTTHNYNVFDDPTLDVKTNLVKLTETLESWKNNNPEAVFNFVSSWFVYGNNGVHRCSEESPCVPNGFYSITKRCAEQLLMSYADTFNLKYRILRFGNVLGGGDKFSAKKNALQYLIDKMQRHETIDVYEKGDFFRNYSHVNDIIDATQLVMKKGNLNEVYNIGNRENYRFMDMLMWVAERIDYRGHFNFIDQKDFHKKVQTKSFRMDCHKLYEDLGFEREYDMARMLTAIL